MALSSRIRFWIIVLLVSLQAITLALVLASTIRKAEALLRSHAHEVLLHVAEVVTDKTERFLEPAEKTAKLSQSLMADGLLRSTNDSALEAYFIKQLQINVHLSAIYLGRLDGSFVFAKREADGFRTKLIRNSGVERTVEVIFRDANLSVLNRYFDPNDTFDPRDRPWFQTAHLSDDLIWTEPYIFATAQRPGNTAALKARLKDGTVAGVIGVDIEITGLSAFLDGIPISKHGSAFIQDEQGVMVAYPGIPRILAERGRSMLHIRDVEDPAVQALRLQKGAIPKLTFTEFDVRDKTHYALIKPFSVGNMTWYMTVHAPDEDFTGHLETRYRQSLWEIFAISTLLVILAIPFSHGVTRPFETLHRRATTDALTGLLNRSEFLQQADILMRSGKTIIVAMLDLDGFKPINDSYGHAIGDEVLETIARRLKAVVRDGDVVGRFGGDEFALILQNIPVAQAEEAVERVRSAVAKPIKSSAASHLIGATAGVVITSNTQIPFSELLAQADGALVKGKMNKKGTTYVA